MLQKWVEEVVGAREIASELRAYLVGMVRRFDGAGWLHISAQDALDEARRVGRHRRGVIGEGVFECGCGRVHRIDGAVIECACGGCYLAEWAGEGWRIIRSGGGAR